MRNVTLADVARETGYSINTVSHALRDKEDISDKTKEYIKQTAKEMGYIVNVSAGSLRSGKSRSVAIIVGDISNPHFSIMIKEMESTLRLYDYTAVILNTDENEELEYSAIVSAISKNVDGIILCPVQKSFKNIDFLNKNGIPYVLFGRRFEGKVSNYVICDDLNGGYSAAEHLIELNHRSLLFINAPLYISSSRDRLEGIKRAVKAYNLPQNALAVEEVSVSDGGSIREILERHADCTGIICFSDLIALEVCHFLKQLGINVPEDASVIGFDNIMSKFMFPMMLSSVTSSKTKMSEKAVEILMDVIDNPHGKSYQLMLPTKVVARESTGECHISRYSI